MAVPIIFTYNLTGRTLSSTIQRISDGYYWNPSAVAFQSAPTYANKKITMTEGSAENLYSYTASVGSIGSPGKVRIRIHDEGVSNQALGASDTFIINNDEVLFDDSQLPELSSIPAAPALYQMIQMLFQRFMFKHTEDTSGTPDVQKMFKANGITVLGTQEISESGGIQTVERIV